MTSYGVNVLKEISDIEGGLQKMLISGYDKDALKNSISKLAAKIETYLKRDVFPNKSNRDNLYSFIEELKNYSITDSLIQHFHNIRQTYNDAKHEPDMDFLITDIVKKASNARQTIETINRLALGRTCEAIQKSTTRVFWVCAWDHYTRGQTEVTIFLPSEYDGYLGAYALDMVLIDALKWDEFKQSLPNYGVVLPHEDWIPKGQTDFWISESDCLTPFVFEGEYKSLLISLAKFERVEDLLLGLSRADSGSNLIQSCVLACVDAFSQEPDNNHETQILLAIKIANAQYAVPEKENDRLRKFTEKVVTLIEMIPSSYRGHLTGPIWTTSDEFDKIDDYARDNEIYTLIDKVNRVVLGFRKL